MGYYSNIFIIAAYARLLNLNQSSNARHQDPPPPPPNMAQIPIDPKCFICVSFNMCDPKNDSFRYNWRSNSFVEV